MRNCLSAGCLCWSSVATLALLRELETDIESDARSLDVVLLLVTKKNLRHTNDVSDEKENVECFEACILLLCVFWQCGQ